MTLTEVLQDIETHFSANWSSTPIAWPNVPFNSPKDNDGKPLPWVRCTVLPDETNNREVGSSGVGIRRGVVKIQVFTGPNIGSRSGAALAGDVEALFHLKDVGEVRFKSAYTNDNGLNAAGTLYQHTVTAPWWAWVNE
jgi:hypothetical protein